MPDPIWLTITALAALIDGNPATAEEVLNKMEADLKQFSKDRRDQLRRNMIAIVAQLARAEVRMVQSDGPVDG